MGAPNTSKSSSDGITVSVSSEAVPGNAGPSDGFVFSYHILIHNDSESTVTLVRRHWLIIDANGQEEEIEGEGVVGQQPRIQPNRKYNYSSFATLPSAWGTMEGHYEMQRDDGSTFEVPIARFHLFVPEPEHQPQTS